MVFHDYECEKCEHRQIDVPSDTHAKIRRTIQCTECDGTARMIFVTSNHINSQHSGMYGKFHAGFGQVVESYSQKQELLKKYNVNCLKIVGITHVTVKIGFLNIKLNGEKI